MGYDQGMLKKMYIALAILFVISSVVYFIYNNPESPIVATLPDLPGITMPTASPVATMEPTFDTSPLAGGNNALLTTETSAVVIPTEPFCTTEPCASIVAQIESAFKNCQVQGVSTTRANATLIQLKNGQFIQAPRSAEGTEFDIQSQINANEKTCEPDPVWVLE